MADRANDSGGWPANILARAGSVELPGDAAHGSAPDEPPFDAYVGRAPDLTEQICERLTTLDLRVVLFSHLVEIQRKLTNPKFIELQDFEQTRESAYTDQLTGLSNYRFFAEHVNHEVLRADQYDAPVSLIMIDIDHFKNFNDRNGHEAGNEILRRIGQMIRRTLRKVDIGARYGGKEFALVLPSTPKTGALLAAERLREAIATHDFPHGAHQPLGRLTTSLGVATYPADARNAIEFVERADRALFQAKADGKNSFVDVLPSDRRLLSTFIRSRHDTPAGAAP